MLASSKRYCDECDKCNRKKGNNCSCVYQYKSEINLEKNTSRINYNRSVIRAEKPYSPDQMRNGLEKQNINKQKW